MIGVNVYTIQKDGMTFRGHDGDDRFVTVSEFMAVVDRVTAFPHADVANVIRNAIAVAIAANVTGRKSKVWPDREGRDAGGPGRGTRGAARRLPGPVPAGPDGGGPRQQGPTLTGGGATPLRQ
jgi:hypothetical protein